MTDATTPIPDFLGGVDDRASPVRAAQDEAWSDHVAGSDADEPGVDELPGGTAWQAVYDEAQAFAGSDPKDFWNRLSEDERGRYATLAAVQRRHRVDPPERNPNLRFVSARELVATTPPDIRWAVRHLLARGALTEIDGAAKRAGKSTLLGFMFRALLHGQPFLGWPTQRSRIVLLSEMHDTPLVQLLGRTGLAETDDLRILKWAESRLVRWPDVVADSILECAEFDASVFVVDTLPQWAGIRGDSENDAGAALAAIEPLQAAAATGLAVGIVRHERKGGGVVGESGRGSTAFTGAVDIVVRLAQPLNPQRETIRQLSVLSRFDGAPADLMIELTDTGYEVLGEETAVVFGQVRNDLKYFLPNAPHGWAEREIVAALPDHSRSTVQRALGELVNAGEVVRMGAGRRGSPFLWGRTAIGQASSEGGFRPAGEAPVSPGGSPPKGGNPPTGRNEPEPRVGGGAYLGSNGATSVGDRMAEILEADDLPDEPEDVDRPDDIWSAFGPADSGGVA